jgi:hypothetical protein
MRQWQRQTSEFYGRSEPKLLELGFQFIDELRQLAILGRNL